MRYILAAMTAASVLSSTVYAQTTAPALAPPTTLAGPATAIRVPDDAFLSGQIDDLDLRNASNENVGEIEDAVLSQGRIIGYVISVGGFLGVGDRNIVVDPSMVTITYNSGDNRWEARINATKEQLQAAQEFKYEGRWEDD
jgi:hypothetical protein